MKSPLAISCFPPKLGLLIYGSDFQSTSAELRAKAISALFHEEEKNNKDKNNFMILNSDCSANTHTRANVQLDCMCNK